MSHHEIRLMDRLALSVEEAAKAIGVSERHLRTVLPEIPHFHIGRRVAIPIDLRREWLRQRGEAERTRGAEGP